MVAQINKMTPERLTKLLTQDGHQVEVKKFDNGATVIARVKKDGWQFQVEFEFNAPGKNLNVICPLRQRDRQVLAGAVAGAAEEELRTAAPGSLLLPGERSAAVPGRPDVLDQQHERRDSA